MEPEIIRPVILAVDDEPSMGESYKMLLEEKYSLFYASTGHEALEIVQKEPVNLVLLDVLLPDMDGMDILRRIKEISDADVIMVSAVKTMRTAIQAVKLGAYDYVSKPFDIDDLLATVGKAIENQNLKKEIVYLKSSLPSAQGERMVGSSEGIRRVFSLISEVCNTQSTVLITGESGTGKELIARAVHFSGYRKDKPFVAVDCATIPENLVESELFGHEKGAFTDATSQKIGKFELANGGTLFLDEIGNLHQDIQSKILRVLEVREIQRVGGTKTIKIDVRVISATNIDLKKAVKDGKFRQDLYYRLNVFPVYAPALRERKEDVPLLINHFISIYNRQFGKDIHGVSKEAMELLVNYSWPGNIRELRNVIERLVVLSKEDIISHKRLPLDILFPDEDKGGDMDNKALLKEARYEFEKRFILKVLERANWNQTKAAQLLGIHRNALLQKINIFKLRPFIDHAKSGQSKD
ncbi:MAG: hypothetical protein A2219_06215 [Elusimicrobia bacterium RIFOXYA2_FULL_50_26]|nr:MAG: hypothetical protein A2219_06215 [Elusimicrobia bacterium RIFOXYA2_FULL_50_26]OGS24180.1 MAG: hypothetical protein A2314_04140 [Elusimicrobia bacterium RIFOXYB2_FULL_50_12]